MREEDMCYYIFFAENVASYWRIIHLIAYLVKGLKVPLVVCPVSRTSYIEEDSSYTIAGQYSQ